MWWDIWIMLCIFLEIFLMPYFFWFTLCCNAILYKLPQIKLWRYEYSNLSIGVQQRAFQLLLRRPKVRWAVFLPWNLNPKVYCQCTSEKNKNNLFNINKYKNVRWKSKKSHSTLLFTTMWHWSWNALQGICKIMRRYHTYAVFRKGLKTTGLSNIFCWPDMLQSVFICLPFL